MLITLTIKTACNNDIKREHSEAEVKKAMEHLIDRATNYDIEALETIYHKDFHTTLVLPNNEVITYNKEEFKTHFAK
ncbi:hypothetical protein [Aureispira anguillae]|nr:hypothetical protein [Aureispira anguillae]